MMDSGISRDAAIPESENYVHYPALLGLLRGDLGDHDLFVVTIRWSSFTFLIRVIPRLVAYLPHIPAYAADSQRSPRCDPLVALHILPLIPDSSLDV